ncbi:MAG: arsenate reductase (glutaredoxin) [Candidatus Hydrogenedentes bacterium]|nr:arsenate reductase (glutaredoxin) [Candidatus Hydrogenedentota bacterium]
MKNITIYHNPRCTKSRETLALLKDHGIAPAIVEYLKDPPTKGEVKSIMKMLDEDAAAIVRTKEPAYKESGLTAKSSADDIARAIAKDPILLERPIVISGKKAAIGRPPEKVLDIL